MEVISEIFAGPGGWKVVAMLEAVGIVAVWRAWRSDVLMFTTVLNEIKILIAQQGNGGDKK